MAALSFGFTKLVVDDLERVERFYCAVFGMKRVHFVSTDDHSFALDEAILTLTGRSDSHALIITRYRSRACPPPGAVWTGFTVNDIGATLDDVARGGGGIEVPVHDNLDHRVRAAIVSDPEGHLIEIIQTMA